MERDKKINTRLYPVYLILAIIFLSVFSYSTSPLYNSYGGDSSIFMLIGRGILDGKVPYVDLFDHKGPILFFIESFGQWIIRERTGIFIIQIVNLFICLFTIHKISELFIPRNKIIIVILSFLTIIGITLRNGNISEEYSLSFLLITIYLSICYFKQKSQTHKPLYAFIYGICFMSLFLIKMNNIIPIAAVVFVILVDLIIKKDYKNVIENAVGFIAGILIVLTPICIYFISKDAIYEMIYGTILFNFKYMEIENAKLPLINTLAVQFMTILPSIVLIILGVKLYYKKYNWINILFISVVSLSFYLTINMGHRYIYYHVINAIPFSLGVMLFIVYILKIRIKFNGKIYYKKIIPIIGLIFIDMLLYAYIGRDVVSILSTQSKSTYNIEARELGSIIPNKDKESVLGYNTSSQWFLANDILPCTRFYTNQDWWNKFDKIVCKEINELLDNNSPKWIIVSDIDNIQNEDVKNKILSNYELIDENSTGSLYKYKN